MGAAKSTEEPKNETPKEITKKELEIHNCAESGVWIAIKGKVYDLSKFLDDHPGGDDVLLEVAGKDATAEFEDTPHTDEAMDMMKDYFIGNFTDNDEEDGKEEEKKDDGFVIKILYGSQKGTGKGFAEETASMIQEKIAEHNLGDSVAKVQVEDMESLDPEDLSSESLMVFVISTYTNGQPPDNAKFFCNWLKEAVSDWRVHDNFLRKLRFAIFGLGNSIYDANYNKASKDLACWLKKLGAHQLYKHGQGDENIERKDLSNMEKDFKTWLDGLWGSLEKAIEDRSYFPESTVVPEETFEDVPENLQYEVLDDEEEETTSSEVTDSIVDMEEIGTMMKSQTTQMNEEKKELREMVTPALRRNLQKQGYKVLGSHSGVKLCRWTKGMLRGRGGCYKHTFYGITSYQCMEMTPSLACANKCVFCWRHHTNPVGREWRWKLDEPEMLIEESIKQHRQMIKQMKGVPGVLPDRYEAAMKPRHCALSLVGEPIMYPHIQRFLDLLHSKDISSFLVTNAQFPDKLREIGKATQLYVSVDASTKENLKEIDRPLFKDFWERFLECLSVLKDNQQRTVYRLTLVKSWNMEELANYARLIARGCPTFIEIKGVTFCGTSGASGLTMENVPFHIEVRNFALSLCDFLAEDYEIACEHVHSCCILLAQKKLKIDGEWHTWIDYPKFHELLRSGEPFGPMDYIAKTPEWAVFGAKEEGFDPQDERFYRKKNKAPNERAMKARAEAERQFEIDQEKRDQEGTEEKISVYTRAKLELALES